MLKFNNTSEIEPLEGILGQERAIEAMEIGLKIDNPAYNMYLAGDSGTGKTTYAMNALNKYAAKKGNHKDWCYVYNFENNFAILRYIANNTNQPENSHIKFIMNFVSHMLWFRSLQENGYIGLTTRVDSLAQWISDNNLAKEFQKFLLDLAGIKTDLDIVQLTQPIPQKILVEKHKKKMFAFEQIASSGSKALELLFYWSKRFDEVSFLFMDEFDAFYHFDLARNVIKYIIDYDNIQVVFTTHNPNLATNEMLRPDCYFILENGKLTSFADSTERELREGHNLEKMLRNGEFNG